MRVLAGAAQQAAQQQRTAAPSTRFMTILGQPKTIALQYANGKQVKSRYPGKPDQVMYTLTSGERAFFDFDVAAAIDSLSLAPGQPFTVCHLGGGSWDIERAAPELNPVAPAPPQQPTPTPPSPRPPASAQAHAPAHAPAQTSSHAPAAEPTTKLEFALKTAIAAAASAEKYAAGIGYQVRFDADMITRQALTVLINMEGGRK